MIPENKIIEYIEGHLSEVEVVELEAKIKTSESLQERVKEYRFLLEHVDNLPEYQPSEKITNNFYQFLKKEQSKDSKKVIPFWKQYRTAFQIAAGIALFVIGLWFGNQLDNKQTEQISKIEQDLQNTQSMMLEMLRKTSASQRIKAVNYSYGFETSDQRIIDALIQTMNFDDNMNVRLHAAEALARFGEEEKVREAFLMSLASQDNPEMQIKTINILVQLNEQRAVGEMLKLLEQDSLIDAVKQQVQNGLEVLL